jgi:hypothetical protein
MAVDKESIGNINKRTFENHKLPHTPRLDGKRS